MRDLWYQALMAQPPRLMGRALMPFCAAHRYTLRVLGNPYAFDGVAGDPVDLCQAVAVCSRTPDQIGRLLYRGRAWRGALAWVALWVVLLCNRRIFSRCDDVFRAYLDDYRESPAVKKASGEGGPMQSPAEYGVVRVLMSEYGMTEAQAWACPWNRALCYCDVHAEAHGTIEMLSPEQEHAYDLINKANSMPAGPEQDALYKEAQAIFNAIEGRDLTEIPNG